MRLSIDFGLQDPDKKIRKKRKKKKIYDSVNT